MELNKDIQDVLIEFGMICKENNWTPSQIEIRSVYDTFRIQNIVEKLSITGVVGQSEQLVCSCGSIKVQTTEGSQCPNNRCSYTN